MVDTPTATLVTSGEDSKYSQINKQQSALLESAANSKLSLIKLSNISDNIAPPPTHAASNMRSPQVSASPSPQRKSPQRVAVKSPRPISKIVQAESSGNDDDDDDNADDPVKTLKEVAERARIASTERDNNDDSDNGSDNDSDNGNDGGSASGSDSGSDSESDNDNENKAESGGSSDSEDSDGEVEDTSSAKGRSVNVQSIPSPLHRRSPSPNVSRLSSPTQPTKQLNDTLSNYNCAESEDDGNVCDLTNASADLDDDDDDDAVRVVTGKKKRVTVARFKIAPDNLNMQTPLDRDRYPELFKITDENILKPPVGRPTKGKKKNKQGGVEGDDMKIDLTDLHKNRTIRPSPSPACLMSDYRKIFRVRYPECGEAQKAHKAAVLVTNSLATESKALNKKYGNIEASTQSKEANDARKALRTKYVKFYLMTLFNWDAMKTLLKKSHLSTNALVNNMIATCQEQYEQFTHPDVEALTAVLVNKPTYPIRRVHFCTDSETLTKCNNDVKEAQKYCTTILTTDEMFMVNLPNSRDSPTKAFTGRDIPIICNNSFHATKHNLLFVAMVHNDSTRARYNNKNTLASPRIKPSSTLSAQSKVATVAPPPRSRPRHASPQSSLPRSPPVVERDEAVTTATAQTPPIQVRIPISKLNKKRALSESSQSRSRSRGRASAASSSSARRVEKKRKRAHDPSPTCDNNIATFNAPIARDGNRKRVHGTDQSPCCKNVALLEKNLSKKSRVIAENTTEIARLKSTIVRMATDYASLEARLNKFIELASDKVYGRHVSDTSSSDSSDSESE